MYRIDLTTMDHYRIDGRVITGLIGDRRVRYVLPAGSRMSMVTYDKRSTIEIGGYKAITVSVSGTADEITKLFEFLS